MVFILRIQWWLSGLYWDFWSRRKCVLKLTLRIFIPLPIYVRSHISPLHDHHQQPKKDDLFLSQHPPPGLTYTLTPFCSKPAGHNTPAALAQGEPLGTAAWRDY